MAKKHVAVSLRKPPSPEKLDAFVSSGADAPAEAPSSRRPRGRRTPAPDSGVREVAAAEASGDATPPSQAASAPDTRAAAAAQEDVTPAAPGVAPAPPPPPPPLVDPMGRPLHAVTVYLSQALAERLTLHCIERDRDASNVIGEALEQHLQKRLGSGTWSQPSAERGAPPPGAAPAWGSFSWDDPFRWAHGFQEGSRVGRLLHLGRALWGLWQRRPWAA